MSKRSFWREMALISLLFYNRRCVGVGSVAKALSHPHHRALGSTRHQTTLSLSCSTCPNESVSAGKPLSKAVPNRATMLAGTNAGSPRQRAARSSSGNSTLPRNHRRCSQLEALEIPAMARASRPHRTSTGASSGGTTRSTKPPSPSTPRASHGTATSLSCLPLTLTHGNLPLPTMPCKAIRKHPARPHGKRPSPFPTIRELSPRY